MQNASVKTIFSEITDFLATNPTPQEIIAYRLPDELQERAHYLLERNNTGDITPAEHDEMLDFARVDRMMTLLRAKMKRKQQNEDNKR